MLFAAVAHAKFGIPTGDMADDMPTRDERALTDVAAAVANLSVLADTLDRDTDEIQIPDRLREFRLASAGTTHWIRSRRVRFQVFCKALLPDPI